MDTLLLVADLGAASPEGRQFLVGNPVSSYQTREAINIKSRLLLMAFYIIVAIQASNLAPGRNRICASSVPANLAMVM